MCLAWRRSSLEAGGAGTASWGKGRDEIRDHTDHQSLKEILAFFLPKPRSFREEEGFNLTSVLTGSFCCNGDTVA